MRVFWHIALLFTLGFPAGCGQGNNGTVEEEPGRVVQKLLIEFDQAVIFPSSILTFRMKGSDRMVPGVAEVMLEGQTDTGADFTFTGTVQSDPQKGFPRSEGDQGDVLVQLRVEDGLWNQLSPTPTAGFIGAIEVRLIDEIGPVAEGRLEGMTLNFRADATPNVVAVPGGAYYPNESIQVQGDNFLRPEEGATYAIVDGTFTYDDTSLGTRNVSGGRVLVAWTGSRTTGAFHVAPDVFGVRPGTFEGSLTFVNELRTLQSFPGNSQPSFIATVQQPFLAALDPPAGSRGQRVTFQGRGFIPASEDGTTSMIFEFDGIFTYDGGGELDVSGAMALPRVPDAVLSDELAEMSVWYEIQDGRLYGLGANPGTFEGTITPVFQDQFGDYRGLEWQGTFRVLPTKQMVHIKYLPGFSKGLEKYGLQNVEFEIRQRILEVTNRDYDGINVEFVERPPTDFLEYATIEIGGPDPTGGGKFGYDNTCNVTAQKCKDTNNLFLGDYLGGVNANSASEYETPYGGVFIESFDYFSKKLNPDSADGSAEFDRIIGPFMPELDGEPVKGTEYPGGPRTEQIDEAIHMVGSVIGNTCTHEVGHSLGLAFFPQDLIRPGESFHNKIPGENYIMDSGSERPFEERGEINGMGPAKFNERNGTYLKDILPLPQ